MSIEEVYQKFKNFIYKQCQSWCGKYEFDDLKQVAFIGLQKAYESYDINKDILFLTYASMIIGNELKTYHRKNKKHEDVFSLNRTFSFKDDEMEYIDTISDNTDYEEIAFNNIQCENLKNAIEKLNTVDREIVEELGLNFKSQKEVAEKLNLSRPYLSRKYRRILEKIRKIMEGDYKMRERKITPEQLACEVKELGTSQEALKAIGNKYELTPSTVRKYLDDFDVRKFSKDYAGKKVNDDMRCAPEKMNSGQENKSEVSVFLQAITIYKGSIGEYQINDTDIELKFEDTTVKLQKDRIMNLILELSELNRIISN